MLKLGNYKTRILWGSILGPLLFLTHINVLLLTINYREFGKSLCTRLQCIVITHARLMN